MVAPLETETSVQVAEQTSVEVGLGSLGDWVLLDKLGQGGQGSTWKARHRVTGKLAAIKRFRVADVADWKRLELFEREARVLAALDHPAIPRLLASGSSIDGAERWIAMELVEGETLARRVGLPSSIGQLARWFDEALAVLDYLHSRVPPVLHRDLKPHNMIVRPDGSLALVDFGSVRVALAPEGGSTVVGTFGFLAPEQLHGAASPASDLYALGVTMIALASGIEATQLPRKGLRIDAEALLARLSDRRLAEAWTRLIEPDPDKRPRDVAAVRALLREETAPSAPVAVPEPAIDDDDPSWLERWNRWRPTSAVGHIALLVLFVAMPPVIVLLFLVRMLILPNVHAAERRRVERRYRRDPVERARQLAALEQRQKAQQVKLRRAREQVERVRTSIADKGGGHRGRLPRGRRP